MSVLDADIVFVVLASAADIQRRIIPNVIQSLVLLSKACSKRQKEMN